MRKRAFTLLEILITTVLLVVGVMAVVKAITDATSIDSSVEGRAVALALAQEKIETVRNTAFGSIVSVARAPVTGFDGYVYEVTVTPAVDLKQIGVKVFWSFKGVEQHIDLSTLSTNPIPG